VHETSQVSVNKPRNWSFPLRETTAVAAAIINLLNVKNPPPEGEGKGCYQEGTTKANMEEEVAAPTVAALFKAATPYKVSEVNKVARYSCLY